MERDVDRLYRSSIIITGAHYSISTLLGSILKQSRELDYISEMFKWEPWIRHPTLVVDGWYPYFEGCRFDWYRGRVKRTIAGLDIGRETTKRIGLVRSAGDVGRLAYFVRDQLRRRWHPRRAIIKEPFLALTAPVAQRVDGLRVVIGVRHPCAWVESALRRDDGFDVRHFDKPETLAALPEFADEIVRLSREGATPLQSAVFTWRLLFSHHAQYLLGNPLTHVVRLKDLVAAPLQEAEKLFAFAGVAPPEGLPEFLDKTLNYEGRADWEEGANPYTRRDSKEVLRKWKSRLSADDVAIIRSGTEDVASLYGYEHGDWEFER